MAENYFVRVRGRTLGPYDLDTIRQMARRAQIGRSHEVSLDGASWASASAYPEIFERAEPSGGGLGNESEPEAKARNGADPLSSAAALGGPSSAAQPGTMWHYTIGGQQQGAPIDQQSLINLIATGRVGPEDSVWNETMSTWVNVAYVPHLAAYALPTPGSGSLGTWASPENQGGVFPHITPHGHSGETYAYTFRKFVGRKTTAGVLALFFGPLGIHKFVLGLTTGGLTMLLLFCLLAPIPVLAVISFVEAILYLTKTDEQFFRDYAVNKKQWF